MLSGNVGWGIPSLPSPSALLQLASISQKGAYEYISSPDVFNSRGHLQIAWLWWPAGLTLVVPQDCIDLHTFKAAA